MWYVDGGEGVDGFMVAVFNTSNSLAGHGLVPTLCSLCITGHLPRRFRVLKIKHAICRSTSCQACVCGRVRGFIGSRRRGGRGVSTFIKRLRCLTVSPTLRDKCKRLHLHVRRLDKSDQPSSLLFCLTAPPSLCNIVPLRLGSIRLGGNHTQVVIRGPFKCSLRSTRGLGGVCTSMFSRRRVCQVSRFLNGRATRGLLTFHFTGNVFRPL